ncbi:MAG: DUF1178 family protein [Hyphomicrobiales bacterium]
MIRFALTCDQGHVFDAWFSSGDSYDEQVEARAIVCPDCGSSHVEKAPMAPAVLRGKSREGTGESSGDSERRKTYAVLKGLREHLKANADDVGRAFLEEARKMHYGEADARNIYGEATTEEAKALHEEGIPALPLPPLPEEHN